MALSGVVLFGFVVGHLLGNLQVLGALELINTYAHFLKTKPMLLSGAEAFWSAKTGEMSLRKGKASLTVAVITCDRRTASLDRGWADKGIAQFPLARSGGTP